MSFDETLDKQVFSETVPGEKNSGLKVAIYSYDNGPKKLQISRELENGFGKLGRLTKTEVQALLPLLEKAMEEM